MIKFPDDDVRYTEFCPQTPNVLLKDRYDWADITSSPGKIMNISKYSLKVDPTYQRNAKTPKIRKIAGKWNWMACGAIIVANRNGVYYVIDGQHRVFAAQKRPEIDYLPCIVFDAPIINKEADAWLEVNTNRGNPTSIEKFAAQTTRGDDDALYLKETCRRLGICITEHADKPMQMGSTIAPLGILARNREMFDKIMILVSELCKDHPITVKLLLGLEHIGQTNDLTAPHLRKRILKVGTERLITGANKSQAMSGKGGARVYALGMLDEINYKTPTKYNL